MPSLNVSVIYTLSGGADAARRGDADSRMAGQEANVMILPLTREVPLKEAEGEITSHQCYTPPIDSSLRRSIITYAGVYRDGRDGKNSVPQGRQKCRPAVPERNSDANRAFPPEGKAFVVQR